MEEYRLADYYPEFEKYGGKDGGIEVSESIFHRESELILAESSLEAQTSALGWSEEERVAWAVERFYRLIEKCDRTEIFFEFLRDWIKQIPVEDRKKLPKREIRPSSKSLDKKLEELDLILADRNSEALLGIVINHIHVCCNRLFHFGSVTQEQHVIYGIYKKLGRTLYCATTKR